jgi:hypothetical protein
LHGEAPLQAAHHPRSASLRRITREPWRTRDLVAADQAPPNLDGSS